MVKRAASQLSLDVEQLVIDLYYHFEKSSKRKEIFKGYQEFCNVETRKILKQSSTRWLSLMKCIDRILRQYDALKSYFLSCEEEKSSEKDKKKSKVATFLHSVQTVFDSFTALLEVKEPMIHKVRGYVTKLFKELLGRFLSI